jgi:hypothetical protein
MIRKFVHICLTFNFLLKISNANTQFRLYTRVNEESYFDTSKDNLNMYMAKTLYFQ